MNTTLLETFIKYEELVEKIKKRFVLSSGPIDHYNITLQHEITRELFHNTKNDLHVEIMGIPRVTSETTRGDVRKYASDKGMCVEIYLLAENKILIKYGTKQLTNSFYTPPNKEIEGDALYAYFEEIVNYISCRMYETLYLQHLPTYIYQLVNKLNLRRTCSIMGNIALENTTLSRGFATESKLELIIDYPVCKTTILFINQTVVQIQIIGNNSQNMITISEQNACSAEATNLLRSFVTPYLMQQTIPKELHPYVSKKTDKFEFLIEDYHTAKLTIFLGKDVELVYKFLCDKTFYSQINPISQELLRITLPPRNNFTHSSTEHLHYLVDYLQTLI